MYVLYILLLAGSFVICHFFRHNSAMSWRRTKTGPKKWKCENAINSLILYLVVRLAFPSYSCEFFFVLEVFFYYTLAIENNLVTAKTFFQGTRNAFA